MKSSCINDESCRHVLLTEHASQDCLRSNCDGKHISRCWSESGRTLEKDVFGHGFRVRLDFVVSMLDEKLCNRPLDFIILCIVLKVVGFPPDQQNLVG